MQCSSRIVFSDVLASAAVDVPIDYTELKYVWLDIATDSRTSISTMSRVGDSFVLTYSNSSIFYGRRKGHHVEQITLLSNDSAWLPLSSTVHDQVVYIGERNQSARTASTANARIRYVDLSSGALQRQQKNANGSGVSVPHLEMFLGQTIGVDDLSTMPASCVPESLGNSKNTSGTDEREFQVNHQSATVVVDE